MKSKVLRSRAATEPCRSWCTPPTTAGSRKATSRAGVPPWSGLSRITWTINAVRTRELSGSKPFRSSVFSHGTLIQGCSGIQAELWLSHHRAAICNTQWSICDSLWSCDCLGWVLKCSDAQSAQLSHILFRSTAQLLWVSGFRSHYNLHSFCRHPNRVLWDTKNLAW